MKIEQILHRDECLYIQDKLEECEENEHVYYIHSKGITKEQRRYLVDMGLFVYRGTGYTYVCRKENEIESIEAMPLKPKDL